MRTIAFITLNWVAGLTLCHCAAARERTQPPGDVTAQYRVPCSPSDPACLSSSSSSSSSSPYNADEVDKKINLLSDLELEEEEEEEEEEVQESLNCVFSSVPFIGGTWLTNLARSSFADSTLLQATHSFLMGGRLVGRLVDLGSSSAASRLLMTLERCLEIKEPQQPSRSDGSHASGGSQGGFEAQEVNHLDETRTSQSEEPVVFPDWVRASPVWTHLERRRKRAAGRSGGYGADPLVGFNFLGFLVVGALITFLVHMLV